jgi:hypothetical protein
MINESLQIDNAIDMFLDVLGDKIYPQVHAKIEIVSIRRDRPNMTQEEISEDTAASSIRVAVEHSFAKIVNLFPFVDFKNGFKINEREVGRYVIVAALMVNLHTCLYGSQICLQFSVGDHIIHPPTRESYMSV